MELIRTTIDSPAGALEMYARGGKVCALGFADARTRRLGELRRRFGPLTVRDVAPSAPELRGPAAAMRAYLAGDLAALRRIAVDVGGTPFQRSVWRALRRIPAGRTWSYAQLAARVGRPRAVRAVGTANGANPVAIAIPCHRVIGTDGALHGYGGGMRRKRWLLEHELAGRRQRSVR
jgi:methylated-DNA-[protein]-cysteine S-methyltransferase